MKAKIRLTIDVTYETNGTAIADLKDQLYDTACSLRPNRELTGDTAVEVEDVACTVEYLLDTKKPQEEPSAPCRRCSSPLDLRNICTDLTCPFSDRQQSNPDGWAGHPEKPPANAEDASTKPAEQQKWTMQERYEFNRCRSPE